MPTVDPFRSRVIPLIGIALAVAGIILSFMLTRGFFQHTVLAETTDCAINSYIDCDKVSASSFAAVGSVPISTFSLGLHGAILVALVTAHFVPVGTKGGVIAGTVILSLSAAIASVVLAIISAFIINALCIYCTFLQLINLSLSGTMVLGLTGGVVRLKRLIATITGPAVGIGVLAIAVGAGIALVTMFSLMNTADNELLKRQITEARAVQRLGDRYLGMERFEFRIADSPQLGNSNAPITLVVYADFNCPHCHAFDPMIQEMARADQDVRLIYKFFPLDGTCNPYIPDDQRSTSCAAAAAAYAAYQEGKFWEYLEVLFSNFQQYGPEELVKYGQRVGLKDPNRVISALNDTAILTKINADISEAVEAELTATPGLYINGRKFLVRRVPPGRDQFTVIRSILEEMRSN